jgi:hypothetical protein
LIPFFVLDRPISLRILKGVKIPPDKKIGLMAHANTSKNFREAFCAFPKNQAIKICDSAIFDLDRNKNNYEDLFIKYKEMGADYGVMIDVLRDAKATIKSAQAALQAYDPKVHHFKLVAVAQGTTVKEYLDCYKKLREMGFKYIAVGGLLHKTERTVRYMRVRDEKLMREVLRKIREQFNPEWLFVLGCLHASRLKLFKELKVWGDYKGWIFEYKKRDDTLHETINRLSTNHLEHASLKFQQSTVGLELKKTLGKRQKVLTERNNAHKRLLKAKRDLQDFLTEVYEVSVKSNKKLARSLKPLKLRGILQAGERIWVTLALNELKLPTRYNNKLLILSTESRQKKVKFQRAEKKLSTLNAELLSNLQQTQLHKSASKELKEIAAAITKVLKISEQTHRIKQVRTFIQNKILKQL